MERSADSRTGCAGFALSAQADLLSDPADVFAFLYRTRIGDRVALLYLAWALVAEKQGRFAFADQVYSRGLARCAMRVVRGRKSQHAAFDSV